MEAVYGDCEPDLDYKGISARAMLVSSRPLSAFDRSRAAKMNICLVDGVEVMKLELT